MAKRIRKLKWGKGSYKELANCTIPISYRNGNAVKRQKVKKKELYPVDVLERGAGGRVKVHYIGYKNNYDEWKDETELETIEEDCEESEPSVTELLEPYSLYKDLGVKIKKALSCNRTTSPQIKLVMPFDILMFNGGLRTSGIPTKVTGGNQHYKINHYRDLNHLLGNNWHFRAINANGDYGYVVLETISFYIRRSKPLIEYILNGDNFIAKSVNTGYSLTFNFVCNYGSRDTFGKDNAIFYDV